jgi:hypothetical protein
MAAAVVSSVSAACKPSPAGLLCLVPDPDTGLVFAPFSLSEEEQAGDGEGALEQQLPCIQVDDAHALLKGELCCWPCLLMSSL